MAKKTPSFAVNPAKNMFYCFGCHEGGDIFKFIMKIENCGFVDALKLLAGKYGIPVPEKQKTAAEIKREQKKHVFMIRMNWRQDFSKHVFCVRSTESLHWLIWQEEGLPRKLSNVLA